MLNDDVYTAWGLSPSFGGGAASAVGEDFICELFFKGKQNVFFLSFCL